MTEQIRHIAERLKEMRELSDFTVESLSKELNLSPKLLEQYESGTIDIPVGVLHNAAQAFNVELSVLLTGENPKLHVYCVTRKDKGLNVDRRKQYKYEELAANFVDKKAEPFIVRIPPPEKLKPMEFNSHPGHEFNYVIEGTMKLVINNHELLLEEGDSIYFDSGYPHAMQSASKQPVKFLAIVL